MYQPWPYLPCTWGIVALKYLYTKSMQGFQCHGMGSDLIIYVDYRDCGLAGFRDCGVGNMWAHGV